MGDVIHQKSPFIYKGKTLLDDKNLSSKRMARSGDVLIVHQSSLRMVGRTFLYVGEARSAVGSGFWLIKHQHNPIYLLHIFNSSYIQKQINWIAQKQNDHRGLVGLKFQDIKDILIPLPSPEIQEQVANSLNNLLTNELQLADSLQKMLEIRKKQYEFYKEQILTSEIDKWDR